MPKITLRESDFMVSRFADYIFTKMRNAGISQDNAARVLNTTRQTFAKNLRAGTLTHKQIIKLLKLVKADEEILKFFLEVK